MPSILSRLRRRSLSQQSNSSAHSTTLPASPPSSLSPPIPTLSPSRSEPLLANRRIVEDLPALLESLQSSVSEPPSSGLKPPRTRKRSGLRAFGLGPKDDSPILEEPVYTSPERENDGLSPTTPIPTGPSAWKGKQRASQLSQQFTHSPWSTFGRQRHRPARSPYSGSHPPSARSSRMGSVDASARRHPSVGNTSEGYTVSNLASTASIDHKSNSRPTDSSRELSVLAGSLSNQSSRSSKSGAITFGRQSPSCDAVPHSMSAFHASVHAEAPYTSMPVLPSAYSNESVLLRGNTFPRRNTRRKNRSRSRSRSRSPRRDIPQQFRKPSSVHDLTTEMRHVHLPQTGVPPSGEERSAVTGAVALASHSRSAAAEGRRLLSDIAEPHAKHESGEGTERLCSPFRSIPPSVSSPTSPTLLRVENRGDGVTGNLSCSSPHTDLLEREEEKEQEMESRMAERQNALDTLTRRPSDTRDSLRRGSGIASRTGTPSRTRSSKRASQLSEQSTSIASSSSYSKHNGGAGPSSAAFPTIATPSPPTSLRILPRTPRTASEPMLRSVSEKSVLETPVNNKGKRKAEEVDITPPDQRTGHHTTFVIPTDGRRSHHASEASKAPSSYQGRKRARLSMTSTPSGSPAHSRPGSLQRNPTDSWPSRRGAPSVLYRATSKTASMRSNVRPESMNTNAHRQAQAERRRSMSEISFPISALVAPHAPSVSIRSGGYYMRDPRKTPRVHSTPWGLRFASEDEVGSPAHAWMFFIGFILFPLWWLASFWRIPQTRQVGGTDTEKAVTLDDPQVEYDARSWRTRCRIMSVVSFFTYIPFIVLVAVFVPRS